MHDGFDDEQCVCGVFGAKGFHVSSRFEASVRLSVGVVGRRPRFGAVEMKGLGERDWSVAEGHGLHRVRLVRDSGSAASLIACYLHPGSGR